MSSIQGYVHQLITKRDTRFGPYNIAVWVLGAIITLVLVMLSSNLLCIGVFPLALLAGMPVKDAGSPHELAIRKWKGRRSFRPGKGTLKLPPLSRPGKNQESPWDGIEVITARMRIGLHIILLPLIVDPSRNYLTMILKIGSGAAGTWSAGDGDTKYDWDQNFFAAVEHALAVTKEPSLWVSMGLMSRPADKTVGYEYNRSRIGASFLEAALAPVNDTNIDPVERMLGKEAMEHHDLAYDQGGDLYNYVAVRMPWPRRLTGRSRGNGLRANLAEPDVFGKTKLARTVRQLKIDLQNQDLDAEFTTKTEVAQLLNLSHNRRLIDTLHTYAQRDRELVDDGIIEHLDDAPSAQPEAWRPLSVTADKSHPGYILCDGTYIAAGYATDINKGAVNPGFQELALSFRDDICFTASTVISAKLVGPEKTKAREAERFTRMKGDISTMNDRLSDPDRDKGLNDIITRREQLSESGARSGDYVPTFTVLANSLEELEDAWETATITLSRYYELTRLMVPSEITDVLLAQLVIFS